MPQAQKPALLNCTAPAPETEKISKPKLLPVELPPDLARNRLLDSSQAAAFLGYSLAHFRRLYRTGKVPAPVKINGRKVGWPAWQLLNLASGRVGEGA